MLHCAWRSAAFFLVNIREKPFFLKKTVANCDAIPDNRTIKMFKREKVNVCVNCLDVPGRTIIDFVDDGKVEFIDDLDKPAFLSLLLDELEEMKDIKLNI